MNDCNKILNDIIKGIIGIVMNNELQKEKGPKDLKLKMFYIVDGRKLNQKYC